MSPGFWGSAVSGAFSPPGHRLLNESSPAWTKYQYDTSTAIGRDARLLMMGTDQLFIHPCEDPFAWCV